MWPKHSANVLNFSPFFPFPFSGDTYNTERLSEKKMSFKQRKRKTQKIALADTNNNLKTLVVLVLLC